MTISLFIFIFCLICVPAFLFCVDRLKRMSRSNPFKGVMRNGTQVRGHMALAGSSPGMDDKDRGAAASLFQKRDQMFDRLKEHFGKRKQ